MYILKVQGVCQVRTISTQLVLRASKFLLISNWKGEPLLCVVSELFELWKNECHLQRVEHFCLWCLKESLDLIVALLKNFQKVNIFRTWYDEICCGVSERFETWMFFRRGCRRWQFPRCDWLQCDLLWRCPSLPFHTLYTDQPSDDHWYVCFHFSPSSTSPFAQVGPNHQNDNLEVQLLYCLLLLRSYGLVLLSSNLFWGDPSEY